MIWFLTAALHSNVVVFGFFFFFWPFENLGDAEIDQLMRQTKREACEGEVLQVMMRQRKFVVAWLGLTKYPDAVLAARKVGSGLGSPTPTHSPSSSPPVPTVEAVAVTAAAATAATASRGRGLDEDDRDNGRPMAPQRDPIETIPTPAVVAPLGNLPSIAGLATTVNPRDGIDLPPGLTYEDMEWVNRRLQRFEEVFWDNASTNIEATGDPEIDALLRETLSEHNARAVFKAVAKERERLIREAPYRNDNGQSGQV